MNGLKLDESKCNVAIKPSESMECMEELCAMWTAEPWSVCNQSSCEETRKVYCTYENGTRVEEARCKGAEKPFASQNCSVCFKKLNKTDKFNKLYNNSNFFWRPGIWSNVSLVNYLLLSLLFCPS
jgi:hypothetical protein